MKKYRVLIAGLVACGSILGMAGCSGGDVDPQAPVNAPGYYNGEMKPRGTPKGGEGEGAPAATSTTG